MNSKPWKIWVDTGGTFTDCMAIGPSGEPRRLKVLSNGILRSKILRSNDGIMAELPFSITKNFLNGFGVRVDGESRTIADFSPSSNEIILNKAIKKIRGQSVIEIFTNEEVPVFAARLLTETGLKEKFPPIEMKLGSTRGTNALLERKGAKTGFVVTKGFKDLILIGDQQRRDLFALNIIKEAPLYHLVTEADERVASDGSVLVPLYQTEVDRIITSLKKKKIDTVAIAFLNSYKNPIHEQQLAYALSNAGIKYTSLSQELSSQIKLLPRAETAIVNAYLEPIIHQYISNIQSGLASATIKVMSSAGGLLPANGFKPKDSLLSGPAGGVIGALNKAQQSGVDKIITFDMGGTSTDVSRCNGRPDYRFDCTIGNLRVFTPSLNIETIAAGGGSICTYDDFRLTVGPQSAGADPGPACYGVGGPLTITDVNLLLGRLDGDNFSIPINVEKSKLALSNVIQRITRTTRKNINPDSILESFVEIANEKMAEAIKKISIQKGHDPKEYTLLCFGGAGGQHACSIAGLLRITHIIVPYDAGLLSAYGIGNAKLECVKEKLILKNLSDVIDELESEYSALFEDGKIELRKNSDDEFPFLIASRLIFLRLKGQETSLEVEWTSPAEIEKKFITHYKKVYGHWLKEREIEVESIRLIVTIQQENQNAVSRTGRSHSPQPDKLKTVRISGSWKNCPVFKWERLSTGAEIKGPSLILSDNSTLFVEEGWKFDLDENLNAHVRLVRAGAHKGRTSEEAQLELFTNRFTAIAEEMGTLLQRTSFSVNVKERLDFSCALLDNKGNLVVNAPHIPVHLGSMGVCVRAVIKAVKMREGDVIITNHPAFGGSHLPDITLIKPVFSNKKLLGFVANRAHHAEVGGIRPGSMPSDATCLEEEGVIISPTYLVKAGEPQWQVIRNIFTSSPYPTRTLEENIADLSGALRSLDQGGDALILLCGKFGSAEVQRYMKLLRLHATKLIGRKLDGLLKVYRAQELLDDGARLNVTLTKTKKSLHIDFTGSAAAHKGNLNATPAIVNSVVLYVLRLLVNERIPLNEGLLENIDVTIPTGILNPTFSKDNKLSPAVVGGNTEVSQRLVDTLLKALKLSACSQGTMNNFLFGNEVFGYYETICGGVGAGPGYDGADAVHQHMTNTRITDPEILEFRYPVLLEKFEIRKGSGGAGKWRGGNGVTRQFYFKDTLQVSILSQHRVVAPYGSHGGQSGKRGEQFIIRSDNKKSKLKPADGLTVNAGDRIVIKTPGGGGWGRSPNKK